MVMHLRGKMQFLSGGWGGVYYTRMVHNMNNEFTEYKHVELSGWLSV
jgi:hypothetical protein